MNNNKNSGFTLIEVSTATVFLVLAMGLALSGYLFTLKNLNQSDIQNDLDIDVQLAMEKLKVDLRLSSLDKMFYYPEGSGPFEAISFPIAYDSDNDGILEKGSDGKIIWNETIIYHVRPTTPHQLVKTVFNPRDNSLTDVQRQAQLESVVKYGVGDNTYNAANTTSSVIFENLLEWELNPKAGRFDAYSPYLSRDSASLGYTLLDSGSHNITFTTVGKNAASSGFEIGLDQLFVSSSHSPREAEAQLPVKSESGATAISQYMAVGSWKGSHQLHFPATSVGNSFTLTIPNDRWEETNFIGKGYLAEDTQVEFDEILIPRDHIVMLDGMDYTWDAAAQTGSQAIDSPIGLMQNWVVRVMQKGSELSDNGNWFLYNGRQCQLKFDASKTGELMVRNVFIGETTSTTNASLDFDTTTVVPVQFGGANLSPIIPAGDSITSDWVDFEIDKEKNYLVSFRIANSAVRCNPSIWVDNRGSIASTCMVVTNGTAATAKDKTWSDRSGIDPQEFPGIIGLSAIKASYPEEGTYTSQVIDTHLDAPQYRDINWNAELPAGTSLAFKIRTGDKDDLSDATDWDVLPPFSYPRAVSSAYKRYVQFQAIMTSDSKGMLTPKLKDVSIDWTGAKQLVDVGGIFTKGPKYGIFEIRVDNEPLSSALVVDLEIYKDTLTMDSETLRVTSSLKVEITPRNSGL